MTDEHRNEIAMTGQPPAGVGMIGFPGAFAYGGFVRPPLNPPLSTYAGMPPSLLHLHGEGRVARRHRQLLEAIERVKPIVECYNAARVRTLGPEDMTDRVRLRHVDGPEAAAK